MAGKRARLTWSILGYGRSLLTAGTIIVLDPDIPAANQRVFFSAENGGSSELRWQLNGRVLPPGDEGRRWAPRPGQHTLALLDATGNVRDQISFAVRGNDGGLPQEKR